MLFEDFIEFWFFVLVEFDDVILVMWLDVICWGGVFFWLCDLLIFVEELVFLVFIEVLLSFLCFLILLYFLGVWFEVFVVNFVGFKSCCLVGVKFILGVRIFFSKLIDEEFLDFVLVFEFFGVNWSFDFWNFRVLFFDLLFLDFLYVVFL